MAYGADAVYAGLPGLSLRSKYITFVERSLPMQAFAPSRNAGVMLFDAVCEERATWAAGIFQDTDDNGHIEEDSGHSITGRVTALPRAAGQRRDARWLEIHCRRYRHPA